MGQGSLKQWLKQPIRIDQPGPVTAAMNHGCETQVEYSDDLMLHYNYGDKRLQYVNDHEKYQQRKNVCNRIPQVFVSTRGEYEINKDKGYVSNIGAFTPRLGTRTGKTGNKLYCSLIWVVHSYGQDSITGENPHHISGVRFFTFRHMDICGFPKDGYYAYQAAWTILQLCIYFHTGAGRGKMENQLRYMHTQTVKKLNCSSMVKALEKRNRFLSLNWNGSLHINQENWKPGVITKEDSYQ